MMHLAEINSIGFEAGHSYSIRMVNRLGQTIEFEIVSDEQTSQETEFKGAEGSVSTLEKNFLNTSSKNDTPIEKPTQNTQAAAQEQDTSFPYIAVIGGSLAVAVIIGSAIITKRYN